MCRPGACYTWRRLASRAPVACVCSPYSRPPRRRGTSLSLSGCRSLARSLAPLRDPSTQVPFLLHTLNHIPPAPAAACGHARAARPHRRFARRTPHISHADASTVTMRHARACDRACVDRAFTDADNRREVHVYTQLHYTLTAIHSTRTSRTHKHTCHISSVSTAGAFPP